MLIDAHQHFWQLSKPFNYTWLDAEALAAIRHDFLPQHLAPHLEKVGVDRTVVVQTQHDLEENRWALELAEQTDWIAGVVGWVDLASRHCEDQLMKFKEHSKFVGIRHVTQGEPDDDFIVRPEVLRGLKVLEKHKMPFDLLFYVRHLKHATRLAREFPDLPLVLDHLAKPRIKEAVRDDWTENFRAAARLPNVYCKLSGMITEADWNSWRPSDLEPYVQEALEAFGPQRCMFGSDWPVCELAGSYEAVYAALVEALGPLGKSETNAIFGETAAAFYGLRANPAA